MCNRTTYTCQFRLPERLRLVSFIGSFGNNGQRTELILKVEALGHRRPEDRSLPTRPLLVALRGASTCHEPRGLEFVQTRHLQPSKELRCLQASENIADIPSDWVAIEQNLDQRCIREIRKDCSIR